MIFKMFILWNDQAWFMTSFLILILFNFDV